MTVAVTLRESRRQARLDQRRRRLLDAALRLFTAKGFHETSVDEVVSAARMSKSAFYEFFETKEVCFQQLLEEEGGSLVTAVMAAASEGAWWDHRDRMRRGIAAFVHYCARDLPLTRLLLVESVGLSTRVEEVRHRIHSRFAEMVEEEVRRAQESDPLYSAVEPSVFAWAVVGAVNEATAHFVERAEQDADPERLAAGLNRIFAP